LMPSAASMAWDAGISFFFFSLFVALFMVILRRVPLPPPFVCAVFGITFVLHPGSRTASFVRLILYCCDGCAMPLAALACSSMAGQAAGPVWVRARRDRGRRGFVVASVEQATIRLHPIALPTCRLSSPRPPAFLFLFCATGDMVFGGTRSTFSWVPDPPCILERRPATSTPLCLHSWQHALARRPAFLLAVIDRSARRILRTRRGTLQFSFYFSGFEEG